MTVFTGLPSKVFFGECRDEWTEAKYSLCTKRDTPEILEMTAESSPGGADQSVHLMLFCVLDSISGTPCKERAWVQRDRGCEEKFVILKLLIDIVGMTKKTFLQHI